MYRNSLPEPFKSYNYKVPVTVEQRDVLRKALSPQTRKIVDSMISHAKYGEICQLLTEYKRSTIIFSEHNAAILRRHGLREKSEAIKALDVIDATRRCHESLPRRTGR